MASLFTTSWGSTHFTNLLCHTHCTVTPPHISGVPASRKSNLCGQLLPIALGLPGWVPSHFPPPHTITTLHAFLAGLFEKLDPHPSFFQTHTWPGGTTTRLVGGYAWKSFCTFSPCYVFYFLVWDEHSDTTRWRPSLTLASPCTPSPFQSRSFKSSCFSV